MITSAAGYFGLMAGTGLIADVDYLLKKFRAEGEFFANPEVNLPIAVTQWCCWCCWVLWPD